MPQIQLQNASKFYKQDKRSIAAIKHVDLVIDQQDFVFVTGSSGAGKSTLLQLIAGVTEPSGGSVQYLDPLTGKVAIPPKKVRSRVGYMPQLPQLMRRRTIYENLEMTAKALPGRRRSPPVKARVHKALAMVGLPDVEKCYPVELSQGQCRRVELARAIVNSPPVLVLDELTSNLDEDTIWDLFHLLEELNRHGTTIIMATHAKKFVNLMRKRVITMVDGTVFGDVKKGRYGDVV